MQRQTFGGLRCIAGTAPGDAADRRAGCGTRIPRRSARRPRNMFPRPFRPRLRGRTPRREARLEDALEMAPDYAAARWHSGYVWADNHWVKFDEVPAAAPQNQRLAAYRRLREKYRETVEDQWPWPHGARRPGCRTNGGPTWATSWC